MKACEFANQFTAGLLSNAAALLENPEKSKTLWRNWVLQLELLDAARKDIEAMEDIRDVFPHLTVAIIRVNKEINGE